MAKLRTELEKIPNLRLAYLVRKRMKHLDEEYPVHLLFVDSDPRGFGDDRQKLVDDIVDGVEFEGWVFSPPVETLETLGLEDIEGAKIYER